MKKVQVKGFTIIEVALVLAIGGLIFLMVFVALPGLRASQRDTSRRESVMEFIQAVKKYQQNNRGALPNGEGEVSWETASGESVELASWAAFYRDYLGEKFNDPMGDNFKLRVVSCGATAAGSDCNTEINAFSEQFFPNDYTMLVVKQATCSGSKPVGTSNPRKIAVLYILEGAGIYCSNS